MEEWGGWFNSIQFIYSKGTLQRKCKLFSICHSYNFKTCLVVLPNLLFYATFILFRLALLFLSSNYGSPYCLSRKYCISILNNLLTRSTSFLPSYLSTFVDHVFLSAIRDAQSLALALLLFFILFGSLPLFSLFKVFCTDKGLMKPSTLCS